MNNRGFIATSVLYSFFLVFIMIIIILIRSYLADQMVLNKFNDRIMDGLNNDTYEIKFRVKNATISGGMMLINKISGGDYINDSAWERKGGAYTSTTSSGFGKNGPANSYLYQVIENVINGHKYYYGLTYSQDHNYVLNTYIDLPGNNFNTNNNIATVNTSGKKMRLGNIYTASTTGDAALYLGYNNSGFNLNQPDVSTVFTDIVVIDLTELFGYNNEPTIEWLNTNIGYFDGVSYYKRYSYKKGDDPIVLEMMPNRSNMSINILECKDDNGNVRTVSYENPLSITFEEINNNLSCYIEWN